MPKRKLKKVPTLVPLQYGEDIYCELCKEPLRPGQLVAWWRVRSYGGRKRWAVYCQTCHRENVDQGRALR
jgi:RNase P subunit RPR2